MTAVSILDICKSDVETCSSLSRTFGIHRVSVRRLQALGAAIIEDLQDRRMTLVQARCEQDMHMPDFVISSLAWDETQETLRMPLYLHGPGGDTFKFALRPSASWHVLVSRQCVKIGVHGLTFSLDLMRPVVPLTGVCAVALNNGLFGVPCVAKIKQFELSLFQAATLAAAHHDTDGASSNFKLIAHRSMDLPEKTCVSCLTCGNHNNQLTDVALNNVVGMKCISSLYSFVLFLRMGSHWIRLLTYVPHLVKSWNVLYTPPPGSELREELMDYAIANRVLGEGTVSKIVTDATGEAMQDPSACPPACLPACV